MFGEFDYIVKLYKAIEDQAPLDRNYCVVFVYNSAEEIRDEIHASECIYPEELNMIVESFRKSALFVYPIDGEIFFAERILELKAKHRHVLVYSMAQDLDGIGRRCLVPLLCDYYNLINMGAGFMPSVFGGSKYLMHTLLETDTEIYLPETHYIIDDCDIEQFLHSAVENRWLLKPNDESASIGLTVVQWEGESIQSIKEHLLEYKNKYPIFCIQEFIEGEEVAVPLFELNKKYYCPGISQVDFNTGQDYLDYATVAFGECRYKEYHGNIYPQLIKDSVKVAKTLGYGAISRVDFRIKDNIGYIEDIGPNPTISYHNGVNELFRNRLNNDEAAVYRLLLYRALIDAHLFEPPLY